MMKQMILFSLAGALNAFMDIVENENFHSSLFHNLNQKFWYKRESWKYAKKVFNYKLDAWHLAKSSMLALLIWAATNNLFEFLAFGIIWISAFNLMYRIFKVRR